MKPKTKQNPKGAGRTPREELGLEPLVVFTIRLERPAAKQFDFVCKANKLSQSKMVEAWASQDMRWHEANQVGNLLR